MLLAEDFRREAREALKGKWGPAVGTGFVASMLGAYTALGTGGSGGSGSEELTSDLLNSNIISDEIVAVILVILGFWLMILVVLLMVNFVIGGAITLGYVKFNLNLVDKKDARFSDLFSQFGRLGQGFVLQLLRSIFIFLWTLLFLIPGIIATYRYAMAPYILCENPYMSASEAITASKELMDGNKWRLFCLDFSFIGWALLCVFTLGIGFLWLYPYQEAAYAAFYREIKRERYGSVSDESEEGNTYNYYEANL